MDFGSSKETPYLEREGVDFGFNRETMVGGVRTYVSPTFPEFGFNFLCFALSFWEIKLCISARGGIITLAFSTAPFEGEHFQWSL